MVERPGVVLTASPSIDRRVTLAGGVDPAVGGRVAALLKRLRPLDLRHVHVESCAPQHHGLGTGTQLSLAVAAATDADAIGSEGVRLGKLTGRGRRSAVGIHGFDHGGLVADDGQPAGAPSDAIAPLSARLAFPDWPVLLVTPAGVGVHGADERRRLADGSSSIPKATTGRLRRLLAGELLPAVAAADYDRFALAVTAYNRTVGDCFAAAQGGPYATPLATALVERILAWGVPAVGQSSWGPTLFAVCRDEEHRAGLRRRLADDARFAGVRTIATHARNSGRSVGGGSTEGSSESS